MRVFLKKIIDEFFELGVFIKFLIGVSEFLAGVVLAVSKKLIVDNLIMNFAQQEILEDPHDFIANLVIKSLDGFSSGSWIFAVFYLLFHGVVNVFLAVNLLKNRIWAYPWAITVFSLFIIYQIFRYLHTHSILLLAFTIFDIFIVFIISLEYYKRSKKKK
jgi:uncharacterized membrane protein